MGTVTDRRRFNGRTPRGLAPIERFLAKVRQDPTTDCWLWVGAIDPTSGYGSFTPSTRKRSSAHRWGYLNLVGPIPEGLHLDHLCRVRHCVNPAHLEPVTPLENTRRGVGHGKETHCPQGHPYDGDNLYRCQGRRFCRTCNIARGRAYRAMTPDERAARKAAGLPVVDLATIFAAPELADRQDAA